MLRFPRGRFFALFACVLLGGGVLWAEEPAVPLLDEGAPGLGWTFENGQEFPGATGQLTETPDGPEGKNFLRLAGNFEEGGAYVQMLRAVSGGEVAYIRFKVRSSNVTSLLLRLNDETGQCHQGRPIEISADGQWQDVEIQPSLLGGGEHWGGADDGVWHGAVKKISFLLKKGSENTPSVDFADIRAEAVK